MSIETRNGFEIHMPFCGPQSRRTPPYGRLMHLLSGKGARMIEYWLSDHHPYNHAFLIGLFKASIEVACILIISNSIYLAMQVIDKFL